ncbi:hypothetical protein Tco_0720638 [Tanacetum coccineum]
MTQPPLALLPSGLPFLSMLPQRRPTTLRACGVFARRSLPVVPSSPLAVVMITPGYALAPVTGTLEPTNARENPGRSVLHSSDRRMLRFEIRSENFDLTVPSRHGKERNKEERNYSLFSCPIPPVPEMHLLRPRERLLCQPRITALAQTTALSPVHNVRAVAHEFKFECPFKVPYALFDQERGGQLPSVLAPAAAPLEPPPVLEPAGSE